MIRSRAPLHRSRDFRTMTVRVHCPSLIAYPGICTVEKIRVWMRRGITGETGLHKPRVSSIIRCTNDPFAHRAGIKIEFSSGSRVVSQPFYYLSKPCAPGRRCRQQLIKSNRAGCGRYPSRSVWRGVSACSRATISAGNLLSQVGLARNLASRVAMLLQSGQKPTRDKATSWKKG